MKNVKIILLIFNALILSNLVDAQQESAYTHYMYNTMCINPAYAGSRNALTITALCRAQWLGFDGAPNTQTITLHSPIVNDVMGLGMSVLHDVIGPVNNTAIFLDYSYRIHITHKSTLSFGIETGYNYYDFDLNINDLTDINDITFGKKTYDIAPNIGVGTYFSNDNYYIGFSVPKLVENTYNYSSEFLHKETEQRHYYFIGGMLIPILYNIKLKPTILVKITKGSPIQGDFTLECLFFDKISLGLMGRSGDGVGALFGYYIVPSLCLGYSFDWSFISETGKYNDGSHEIMLRYDMSLHSKKRRVVSSKYFCSF